MPIKLDSQGGSVVPCIALGTTYVFYVEDFQTLSFSHLANLTPNPQAHRVHAAGLCRFWAGVVVVAIWAVAASQTSQSGSRSRSTGISASQRQHR